ncbi:hypothetical protein Pla52o_43830 [Novipirellula galeiformis]|uniref:Uncharacterized protein n=1 Tax=Novipirellula galeiformis TaxID=2528004 RepID=A0A5C6C8U4_9BACT|nr:hypothetical protein Pla52o_43830 [Novipirellula galeiformis]
MRIRVGSSAPVSLPKNLAEISISNPPGCATDAHAAWFLLIDGITRMIATTRLVDVGRYSCASFQYSLSVCISILTMDSDSGR